jgi:trimethylamine--corrinoid protein Co-methyltransferase
MQAMLQYSSKPIMYVPVDLSNTQYAVAMAEAVAGGAETLRLKPFAACYINIANPLRHNPESIQRLMWLSEKGLPFTYRPSLIMRGVTTPITGAGFLAVNSAAVLAGLVLSQFIREGTPFIGDSCAGGTFDMRSMVGQLAASEIRGFNEDLLHHYGLPGFGNGGMTGAKTVDSQAAFEAALTLITAVQAGAQLIHDVGYMDNGATGSLEQTVICHEMIAWLKAYMQPLVVNDETLSLDTVREVAAGDGDFLGSENTFRHFREDHYPRLTDRQNYEGWFKEGGLSLQDRARTCIGEALGTPERILLSDDQDRAVQAILDQ